jgi:hypothetical protein
MNKFSVILAVVCLVVGGVIGYSFVPKLFGDFSGGQTPSQIFTANISTNSISPINALQNIYTTGAIGVGGTGQYNQVSAIYSASSSLTATTTLGAIGLASSTATSTFSLPANATSGFAVTGLQVGDPCFGGTNNTSTAVDNCIITAVGGGSATGTFAYSNLTGGTVTTLTSTVFRFILAHLPY